jgi:hypothetical protein
VESYRCLTVFFANKDFDEASAEEYNPKTMYVKSEWRSPDWNIPNKVQQCLMAVSSRLNAILKKCCQWSILLTH